MCGGCGGRDADDARPGEAATLGTSPSLPGGGAAAARNTKNGYTLHSRHQEYQHTTLLSTHHTSSLYTTISTCTIINNVKV